MLFEQFGLLSKKLAADEWQQEITCFTILSNGDLVFYKSPMGKASVIPLGRASILTRVKFKFNYHENRWCIKTTNEPKQHNVNMVPATSHTLQNKKTKGNPLFNLLASLTSQTEKHFDSCNSTQPPSWEKIAAPFFVS